jgi:hypothetical protein
MDFINKLYYNNIIYRYDTYNTIQEKEYRLKKN